MKLASIRYLIGEGIKNTWVNRLMTIASVGVLVACMVVIGLAVLISENVNLAVGNLEKQNVAMAYMKDYNWALYNESRDESTSSESTSSKDNSSENTSSESTSSEETSGEKADENGIKDSDYIIHNEEEAKALCEKIEKLSNVESVEFISSDEGLKSVTGTMHEDQVKYFTFLNEDYGNPLSGAAKITMIDMALFDETIAQIQNMEGIDKIQSQSDLAETITAIKNGIAVAGLWIIAILMVISLVIVSNTIRVTMYNRKLEISIMKAVGATDTFIRIPFVVEGMIIGTVSALIAEGVLYFCYRVATETIVNALGTSDIIKYSDMALVLLAIFVGIGLFAGVIGSAIMIGKYLRREGSEFAAI